MRAVDGNKSRRRGRSASRAHSCTCGCANTDSRLADMIAVWVMNVTNRTRLFSTTVAGALSAAARLRRGFPKAARPMVNCTAIIRCESRRHPNGAGLFHQRRRLKKPSPCRVFLPFSEQTERKTRRVCPRTVNLPTIQSTLVVAFSVKGDGLNGGAFTASLSSVSV